MLQRSAIAPAEHGVNWHKPKFKMSHWNYRIIKKEFPKHDENEYQIHEVHYDDNGKVKGWAKNPVSPFGSTLNELREDIRYQLNAFRKPVLKENKEGTTLIPDEEETEINRGHYFEALDRASVAIDYIYQFVGSHPVLKKHKKAKELYDQAEEKLGELYQELGNLEFNHSSS